MQTKLVSCILLLFLLPALSFGQKVAYTQRAKNEVREGPGNYYPLLYVLPSGVALQILKRQNGWIRFQLRDAKILATVPPVSLKTENWISRNSLSRKAAPGGWKELNLLRNSPDASAASVAAAIRGYAFRFGRTSSATLDSLLNQTDLFTPQEYEQFKVATTGFLQSPFQRNLPRRFPEFFANYAPSMEEEAIGLAIAARVAGQGLEHNRARQKYLNLLATLLAEASGAYDYPFKVYILRSQTPNAVSMPGGHIFVASSLLDLCQDEAELAGILAHEIMHIILHHGMQEIQQRLENIQMDVAMFEMEKEVAEKPTDTDEMLEDLAVEGYEMVMRPRLQSYEEEADKGAALLLVRAGYDPRALPHLVQQLSLAVKNSESLEWENPFASLDFGKRLNSIKQFIAKKLKRFHGHKNTERFLHNYHSQ